MNYWERMINSFLGSFQFYKRNFASDANELKIINFPFILLNYRCFQTIFNEKNIEIKLILLVSKIY